MIVRRDAEHIFLVPQAEHARHAARLTGYLRQDFLGPELLRDQILAAARFHDEGWVRWDEQPTQHDEAGWPVNFDALEGSEHLRIWERSVAEACRLAGAAGGALVARHAAELLGTREGGTADTFHAMANAFRRQAWPGLAPEEARERVETGFHALFFGDALSLLVLAGWDGVLELCLYGPGGLRQDVRARWMGGWDVQVDPWPFAEQAIPLLPVKAYSFAAGEDPAGAFSGGWQQRRELLTIGTRFTRWTGN